MDIESAKLELIKKVLNTQKIEVLIKLLEVFEHGDDFWEELDEFDKDAVLRGISQLESGDHSSHDEVREDIKKLFK